MANKDNFYEIGSTGLDVIGGLIEEEFLCQLRGTRAIKVYKEMSENDPTVSAILFAVEMLIRKVKWKVQAVSNETADIERADFLEGCMADMSHTWEDLIVEILSMLIYGWSYHEVVYKKRLGPNQKDPSYRSRFSDGKIGWRKIPIRSQDSLYEWKFDENGGLRAMVQYDPNKNKLIEIPIEKSLLFRTTSRKNNPEGRSILRGAYRPWYFKKNIETIEGIGVERDLAGLPIAFVPPEILMTNASAQQAELLRNIKKIVTNIRRDEQEGIVFPLIYDDKGNKLYDIQLMSTGGRRQFDTNAIITRYDQRIAMTVLADFILLGTSATGSFAMAESKMNLFIDAIQAWLQSIQAVLNRYAVPRLFTINGDNSEELPKIVHEKIQAIDLKELGDYLQKLANAGLPLFPNKELENYILGLADLPITDE